MKFELQEQCRVKYSKGERRVFKFLSYDRKSSTRIISQHYRPDNRPYNARKAVTCLLTSLGRKLDYNKEPFRLMASPRNGPHAVEYWLEKRA